MSSEMRIRMRLRLDCRRCLSPSAKPASVVTMLPPKEAHSLVVMSPSVETPLYIRQNG